MSGTFNIKRGDTSPALVYALTPTPNLTGATVVFTMKARGGAVKVNRAAATAVGPETDGVVSYAWDPADTDTAGTFDAEFEVTFADLSIETYPNASNITVKITADLG